MALIILVRPDRPPGAGASPGHAEVEVYVRLSLSGISKLPPSSSASKASSEIPESSAPGSCERTSPSSHRAVWG